MEEWEGVREGVDLELNMEGSPWVEKRILFLMDRTPQIKVQRKDIFSYIQDDDNN